MMTEVFADTAGWAAVFGRNDPFHPLGRLLVEQWIDTGVQVVTTNYVLAELSALLNRHIRMPRVQQISVLDSIRSATWVEVVHIDPSLDAEAWALFRQHVDKEWSLVDCAGFVVMRQRGITDALTTDRHFEQAGFRRLLK
jgi:predicted nucleic acid-binding protein